MKVTVSMCYFWKAFFDRRKILASKSVIAKLTLKKIAQYTLQTVCCKIPRFYCLNEKTIK